MNSFNWAATLSASSMISRDFFWISDAVPGCLEIIWARPRMMLSGLRVSWARPAAARFISLRWVFISLARTRRICSSEDLARFRQARPEPRAETVASSMMIVRSHKSRVAAASSPSVDMVRTRPCSVRLATRDWSSFSSMPRSQKGRRDRPPGSRERPSATAGRRAGWRPGWLELGRPRLGGRRRPRREKSRPGSPIRLVNSLKGAGSTCW